MIDVKSLKTDHPHVYEDLLNRLGLDEKIEVLSPTEALEEYLAWNGVIGYGLSIRNAMWSIITSSDEYLTTTDAEKEAWLRKLLKPSVD